VAGTVLGGHGEVPFDGGEAVELLAEIVDPPSSFLEYCDQLRPTA